jgi:hypothetical protein
MNHRETIFLFAGIILCSPFISIAEETWKTDSVFAGGDSLSAGGMGDFTLSRYYTAVSLKVFDSTASFWNLLLLDNDSAIVSGSQGEFIDTTKYMRRDSLVIFFPFREVDSVPFVTRGERLITKHIKYYYVINGIMDSISRYVLPTYYDTTTLDSLNSITGFQYIIRKNFVYYLSQTNNGTISSNNPRKNNFNIQIKICNGNLFLTTPKPANNACKVTLYNILGKRLCYFEVNTIRETISIPAKNINSGNAVLVKVDSGKEAVCRKFMLLQ